MAEVVASWWGSPRYWTEARQEERRTIVMAESMSDFGSVTCLTIVAESILE
jgi:hypothetical protein